MAEHQQGEEVPSSNLLFSFDQGKYKRRRGRRKVKEDPLNKVQELARRKMKAKVRKGGVYNFAWDPVTGKRVFSKKYTRRNTFIRGSAVCTSIESNVDSDVAEGPNFPQEDFESEVETCIKAINGLSYKQSKINSSWDIRMKASLGSWVEKREELFRIYVRQQAKRSGRCFRCCDSIAVVVCKDCTKYKNLCAVCDRIVHEVSPLHDRAAWNNGAYASLLPTENVDGVGDIRQSKRALNLAAGPCKSCGLSNLRYVISEGQCIVITSKGRFDVNRYVLNCNECLMEYDPFNLETILYSDLWPGSVNNLHYLFHQDVFRLWDAFRKRMPGSSEVGFINALCDLSTLNQRVSTINSQAFATAFREWNFCQFEIDKLQGKNWMECPSCNKNQHSCHVDGNCKLYRFKSAGGRRTMSYYEGVFIDSNTEVQNLLTKIYKQPCGTTKQNTVDNNCGGSFWKAATNVGRKRGSLDETGLELASCRHNIGQKAVNMFQGELYGYALYIQKNFMIPRNVKFMWCDVICKYWPWAKKVDEEVTKIMLPALSVMHAKGHGPSCQVTWDGEWQDGTGRTSGEEVEQINSFISRLGSTTKHMLPENREDYLTEQMLAWNKRKIDRFAYLLRKRYLKTKQLECETWSDLRSELAKNNLQMESVDFAGWIKNIQSLAVGASRRYLYALGESEQLLILHAMLKGTPDLHKIEVPQSLESTFLESVPDLAFKGIPAKKDLQLKRFKDLCLQLKDITPDGLNSAKQQVLELMKKLYQKLIESSSFNIMHHTSMVKKFGENSKRRHLFRKKVSTEKDKFRTFADCYNLVVSDMERHGHSHIERLDSSKKYEFFPWSDHNTNDAVTLSSKRLLVQLFMRVSRLKEEREIIYEEMRNYLAFYKMLLKSLRADIARLQTIYFPDPIKDMPSSTCNAESIEERNIDQSRQRRYATAYTDQDIVNGMQAVKQTGIWFCLKQIQRGVLLFKDLIHCAVDVPFDEEQIDNLAEIENETDEEGNDEISDESDDDNSETFLCCQDT